LTDFSRPSSIDRCGENRLVMVRYMDHVLFRNLDPRNIGGMIRICVGWLCYEDDDYILIIFDRPVKDHGKMRLDYTCSGLLLLKKAILDMWDINAICSRVQNI